MSRTAPPPKTELATAALALLALLAAPLASRADEQATKDMKGAKDMKDAEIAPLPPPPALADQIRCYQSLHARTQQHARGDDISDFERRATVGGASRPTVAIAGSRNGNAGFYFFTEKAGYFQNLSTSDAKGKLSETLGDPMAKHFEVKLPDRDPFRCTVVTVEDVQSRRHLKCTQLDEKLAPGLRPFRQLAPIPPAERAEDQLLFALRINLMTLPDAYRREWSKRDDALERSREETARDRVGLDPSLAHLPGILEEKIPEPDPKPYLDALVPCDAIRDGSFAHWVKLAREGIQNLDQRRKAAALPKKSAPSSCVK